MLLLRHINLNNGSENLILLETRYLRTLPFCKERQYLNNCYFVNLFSQKF